MKEMEQTRYFDRFVCLFDEFWLDEKFFFKCKQQAFIHILNSNLVKISFQMTCRPNSKIATPQTCLYSFQNQGANLVKTSGHLRKFLS
jgi:hypothetical protein